LGDLRFRRSVSPLSTNSTINDGSVERICPQAAPQWVTLTTIPSIPLPIPIPQPQNGTIPGDIPPASVAAPPLDGVAQPSGSILPPPAVVAAAAVPPSGSIVQPPTSVPPSAPVAAAAVPLTNRDPRESEDCLLLDIMVPVAVFNAAQNTTEPKLSPVLVWIHGGGFTQGFKSQTNPAGLLQKSMSDGRAGIVFVQMNYRLLVYREPHPETQLLIDSIVDSLDSPQVAQMIPILTLMLAFLINSSPFNGSRKISSFLEEILMKLL